MWPQQAEVLSHAVRGAEKAIRERVVKKIA
jgi:hypothetical protein